MALFLRQEDPRKRRAYLRLFVVLLALGLIEMAAGVATAGHLFRGATGTLISVATYAVIFALGLSVYLANRPRDRRTVRGILVFVVLALLWIGAVIVFPRYVITIIAIGLGLPLLIWLFLRRAKSG